MVVKKYISVLTFSMYRHIENRSVSSVRPTKGDWLLYLKHCM